MSWQGVKALRPEEAAKAVELACMVEVMAPKPGNVNRNNDFADTTFEDFLLSGWAVGPVFARAHQIPLGRLVLEGVRASRQIIGTNTNLGIILLFAPLVQGVLLPGKAPLRKRVGEVLANLTVEDSREVYGAIREASAGGLGEVQEGDVNTEPSLPLMDNMALARERDSIAREYCTDFHYTFTIGYPTLRESLETLSWQKAVVHTFLSLLAQVPDTLIARKVGWERAQDISRRAGEVLALGGPATPAGEMAVGEFDYYLRQEGNRLNPGTSADLVAASLLVFFLEEGWHRFFD